MSLHKNPLFASLSPDLLDGLGIRPSIRKFEAGQLVFQRLDPECDVYFLLNGRFLCVFWTDDGKELVFNRVNPGGCFGELSAIDGAPRSLSVYAHVDSEAAVISQGDFLKLLDASADFRTEILRGMVGMIRRLTDRTYQGAALPVGARVRHYLAHLALQSGRFTERGLIEDAPTHAEIANTIGSNREAVSRVMSELKKTGVIESGRQMIRILTPDALLNGEDS